MQPFDLGVDARLDQVGPCRDGEYGDQLLPGLPDALTWPREAGLACEPA